MGKITADYKNRRKVCSKCKIEKSFDDFWPRKEGGPYSSCKECHKEECKRNRDKLRADIIAHYSDDTNRCSGCGEDRFIVLDLDHIDGGGYKERKEHHRAKGTKYSDSSDPLYRRLRKEGYPIGYRVLCRNCNWIAWVERREVRSRRGG